MSAFSLGHQKRLRAVLFIATMPGWFACSIFRACSRAACGMITRAPQVTQSFCVANSSSRRLYGVNSSPVHLEVVPSCSPLYICDNTGSSRVRLALC
uniref:Putative secreted protein n=1 Tax=Ixodes ricinus TaxID=34613 RepID=A0A6B0U4F8_IXORI